MITRATRAERLSKKRMLIGQTERQRRRQVVGTGTGIGIAERSFATRRELRTEGSRHSSVPEAL